MLAEQGWLYKKYFDVFRRLRDKISAVTFWGMADDDTWLDSFPVARTDYPLPFDMDLQAKPAYWGIVDPTQLPGYGLKFSITSKTETPRTRAYDPDRDQRRRRARPTRRRSAALRSRQIFGGPCSPVVTPPGSYPVLLGDIADQAAPPARRSPSTSPVATTATFILKAPWSSSVYHTGTFVSGLDARK